MEEWVWKCLRAIKFKFMRAVSWIRGTLTSFVSTREPTRPEDTGDWVILENVEEEEPFDGAPPPRSYYAPLDGEGEATFASPCLEGGG